MNYKCQGCNELLRWQHIRWVYDGKNVCGKKSQLGYCLDCYAELTATDNKDSVLAADDNSEGDQEWPF